MRIYMSLLHGRLPHTNFSSKTTPLQSPSHYASQGTDNTPDGHAAPECMECVSLNPSSLIYTLSCYVGCRDLNRYLSLCGFSRCNASRVLTLGLTSLILFSTCPLRLHLDISGRGGLVLVTAADTAMGDLHLRRQPLCRHSWPCPHLPLLFVPSPGIIVGQQDSKCDPVHKYHQSLAVGIQTSVGGTGPTAFHKGPDVVLTAILLTRVYALCDHNRIVLWSLLAYYFGFAGFAAVRYPLRSGVQCVIS